MNRITRIFNKVSNLLEPKHSEEYLLELLGYALLGLERGDVEAANLALDEFENIFIKNEGVSIRNKYIKSTIKTTGVMFFISLVLLLSRQNLPEVLRYLSNYSFNINMPALIDLSEFGVNFFPTLLSVTIGICLGMSFFALIQSPNVEFDSIGQFDSSDLQAVLRFILVCIVAIIACVLLSIGVLKLDLAGVKLEEFADHRLTAVALGIMCGYSNGLITRTLTNLLGSKS